MKSATSPFHMINHVVRNMLNMSYHVVMPRHVVMLETYPCTCQQSPICVPCQRPVSLPLRCKFVFLGFPPAVGGGGAIAPIRGTYTDCTCSHGRRHCNKLGAQAPRRGMLFWPILQHYSKSIALLGDCSSP